MRSGAESIEVIGPAFLGGRVDANVNFVHKRSYDVTMGLVLRSLTRGHRVLHRVSGGRLGRRFPGGQQIVWITTRGRRSGQWRTNPLLAVPDPYGTPDAWVVAGSNAGQAKLPGWVYNVRADGSGRVRVGDREWACRFVEASGAERDRLYEALTQSWSSFATYERMAGRAIPVFRVVPADGTDPDPDPDPDPDQS
jgi:deazaflavin-dependent oxidoreductase (nitroreductase family)